MIYFIIITFYEAVKRMIIKERIQAERLSNLKVKVILPFLQVKLQYIKLGEN